MTESEKQGLIHHTFDELWQNMWSSDDQIAVLEEGEIITTNHQYKQEELNSKLKFQALQKGVTIQGTTEFYNLETLIEESNEVMWTEPEWGFPKGRRNYQENEYECAVREFTEETGYSGRILKMIANLFPFEEVFMGSNYKSYKHKYFLTFMDYKESLNNPFKPNTEVSKIEWNTFDACLAKIRDYNHEKKRILKKVDACVHNYIL